MTAPPEPVGAEQPSFARLHGEARWHCGAATGPLHPAGEVTVDDGAHTWPVVACAAHQGRQL
jgi:hypothetical protein